MTVCVLPNPHKSEAFVTAKKASEILLALGVRVILLESRRESCFVQGIEYRCAADAFQAADVLLTIGGDGTILRAARESLPFHKPILGVNLGRTGFLATCETEELETKLAALASGRYDLTSRMMLDAQGEGPNGRWKLTALNDIVIYRIDPLHTIDCSVSCDDMLVNHCRGDGMIVATPTGSTAYSMSAGGPILDAEIEGIVVTPICPHSLQSPSMVFSAHRHITIQIDDNGQGACISSDGAQQIQLLPNSPVDIKLSKQHFQLVAFNRADQFNAIDQKLKGR